MIRKTTLTLVVHTQEDGTRSIDTSVIVSNADQFESEEEKEAFTASDVYYLFSKVADKTISPDNL